MPVASSPQSLAMLAEQGTSLTDAEAALVAAWCGARQPPTREPFAIALAPGERLTAAEGARLGVSRGGRR